MIVAIVTFRLSRPWSLDEAASTFQSTAPKYLGKVGLVRKHYYLSETRDRAGGIYLWKTKADAEACYSPEWVEMVTQKYGSAPEIFYGYCPVTVDNVDHEIHQSA